MEKYEEYDKTYNDAELNDIINNYNEQIDVVHNDEKLIKILEKKSNRTEQEEEKLKKLVEDLQRDQQDLDTLDEDSTIAEQILKKRKKDKIFCPCSLCTCSSCCLYCTSK